MFFYGCNWARRGFRWSWATVATPPPRRRRISGKECRSQAKKTSNPKEKQSKDQFFLVPSVHTVRLVVSCVHIMCGDLRFMSSWNFGGLRFLDISCFAVFLLLAQAHKKSWALRFIKFLSPSVHKYWGPS